MSHIRPLVLGFAGALLAVLLYQGCQTTFYYVKVVRTVERVLRANNIPVVY